VLVKLISQHIQQQGMLSLGLHAQGWRRPACQFLLES
jgi:hypothetical protein